MCYGLPVPQKPRTAGDPDDLVPLQIRLPLWMKRRVVEIAASKGKDISEWLRDLILGETGGRDERPKKGGQSK